MSEEQEKSEWSKWEKFVLKELDRNASGVERLREGQIVISSLLQKYNAELEVHIRGVQALEKRNEIADETLNLFRKEVNTRLLVAEQPIVWAQTTGKLVTMGLKWSVAVTTILGGAYAALRYFYG